MSKRSTTTPRPAVKTDILLHLLLVLSVVCSVFVGIAWARASPQRATSLDGWTIAYEAAGEGARALVFIHGANSSRRAWHRQIGDPALDGRMLAVDLLGAGESDKPDTRYSMELFARSVLAAMDAEGIACATLVSHSNGVPVARELYRMRPERVEAIIAVDGAFENTITPELEVWMRDAFDRPDFEEFRAGMPDMMPTFELAADDVAIIKEDMLATPKHVMLGGLEAFVDPGIWRDDKIDVPLLVLLAEQPMWTPERIEYARAMGPDVEYHMWSNVSHFMQMERADEFNRLVADFLERVPRCS